MLVSTQRRELFLFETITKHIRVRDWWKELKNHESNYFRPNKMRGNMENKNNPVNIRFVDKTSGWTQTSWQERWTQTSVTAERRHLGR